MTTRISPRDWQNLSAYLDDQIPARQKKRLEVRLQQDGALRQALDDIHRTRQVLRSTPRLRVPRAFTLAAQPARKPAVSPAMPAFRFASILASVIFVLVLLGDYLAGTSMLSARREAFAPAAAPVMVESNQAVPTQAAAGAGAPAEAATTETAAPAVAESTNLNAEAVSDSQLGEPAVTEAVGAPMMAEAKRAAPEAAPTGEAAETPLVETAEPLPEPVLGSAISPTETPIEPAAIPAARRFPWRWIEIIAGLVALGSGASAYVLWRKSR